MSARNVIANNCFSDVSVLLDWDLPEKHGLSNVGTLMETKLQRNEEVKHRDLFTTIFSMRKEVTIVLYSP